MNYQLLAENIIKKALKSGADEAEVYLVADRDFELDVRNGNVETIKQATSKGLGLTVFKDKKLGFSYTSDFSDESLQEFIKKTVQLSLVADPKPWNGLPDFKKGKLQDLDLYDPSISEIPSEKKIEIAKEVERIALAYDKRITKSEGGFFGDSERETIIVNSKGISYSSKRTGVSFVAGVVAGEGSEMQSGWWGSSKRHFKDLDTIENVANKAGKRAVEKLGAKPVETQKVPVVFDRYATPAFWYGILFAMDGDSVYKKTTFLTEYLDKSIASELITLVDDPTILRHVSSVSFDGEGNITRKNVLIDKGILKMFIYDTITARKAGVKVNTMARRYGYRSPASAGFLNVILENSIVPREKIISEIKNGYYVTGLRGIGTDIPTGNYSCGSSGFWIKDGEITFPVDGVTLGGNALDMMKNIEVVANDLDLRGSLNSPSFKIAELAIGGKK
jgi:PmbA protein